MARQHSTTLLALVQAVTEYARSDAETVATIAYLITSGTVRLCGTFAGARVDLAAPYPTTAERQSRGTAAAREAYPQPDTSQSRDYGGKSASWTLTRVSVCGRRSRASGPRTSD
jgi:hypothetical protein